MCGILGYLGKNQNIKSKFYQFLKLMEHRGPDSINEFQGELCCFGHTRLSIIDTNRGANQPFFDSEKKFCLVFNGEIYNYKEIRKQLKGKYKFKTNSDTEVVIYAFKEWGVKSIEKFNGMFSFAVWDFEKDKLFLFRDRLGIKPLYYSVSGSELIFSSEIRPILQSRFQKFKLDKHQIFSYLKYQTVFPPNTFIKGINQLRPGEFIEFSNGRIKRSKYWKLNKASGFQYVNESYSQIKKNVKDLFLSSVESRLISDVPIGAFLSGGIDSSAIVAAMSEVSNKRPNTFSIGFEEKQFDESPYALKVASKFNCNHEVLRLKSTDLLEFIPDILNSFDVPSSDGINSYVVSKLVKEKGITVALSGLGGDELFAGYSSFKRTHTISKLSFLWNLPIPIRKQILSIFKSKLSEFQYQRFSKVFLDKNYCFENVFLLNRLAIDDEVIKQIILSDDLNYCVVDSYPNLLKETFLEELPLLSKVSVSEIIGYTQNILLRDTDQMSMANSLEVRVPFFDHRLVEYVLGIPDKHKYPKSPKKLLVDALGTRLPREIVNRKKMGFSFPWAEWLRGELYSICEKGKHGIKDSGLFNANQVDLFFTDFYEGKNNVKWSHIWSLVCLGHWIDNYQKYL